MCRSALLLTILVGLGVPSALCADSLQGVVHDETGKPIPHARVDIATAAPKVGRGIMSPSRYPDCKKWTRTNDLGAFLIEDLDPQLKFSILVTAQDKQSRMTDLMDPRKDTPTVVLLNSPQDVPAGRVLSGRVVSTEGRPIAGALVEPYGAKTSGQRWLGRQVEAQPVSSDDDGCFRMLLNADYLSVDITVSADGFAGSMIELLRPGVESHEITVPLGSSVIGQILFEGIPQVGVTVAVVQAERTGNRHFIRSVLAVTDPNGRFECNNLPASQQYAIFSPIHDGNSMITPTDAPPILAAKLFQCRGDGETRDLGKLELQRGLSLAGRLTMSDGSSLPEGLKFRLNRNQTWGGIDIAVDPDGRFAVAGLAPENYEATVSSQDMRIDTSNQRFQLMQPNTIGIRLKQSINDVSITLRNTKDANATVTSDVKMEATESNHLTAAEAPVTGRPRRPTLRPAAEFTKEPTPENGPKLRVRGTVVSPEGRPIESATIILQASTRISRSDFLARTVTDANGRFTLSEVPIPLRMNKAITSLITGDGGVQILAFAEGYGLAWAEVMSLDGETLKMTLRPEAKVHGTVRDQNGEPVTNTQVKIVCVAGLKPILFDEQLNGPNSLLLKAPEVDFSASTNDRGDFVLQHVPEAAHLLLTAEHCQHDSASVFAETITPPGESRDPYRVTLTSVRKIEMSFVRSPLSFVLKRVPTISVRITDPTGLPIRSGSLHTYRKSDEPGQALNLRESSVSSEVVTVPIPQPGTYRFAYNSYSSKPQLGLSIEREITPESFDTTIEMRLPEHQWITGRVVNSVTNQPVPGVSVRCSEQVPQGLDRTYSQGVSGTDGHFRIPAKSGKNRVRMTGDYYGYLTDHSVVLDNRFKEIEIDLPVDQEVSGVTLKRLPGLKIHGTLTDTNGQRLRRTVVRAEQIESPFHQTATRSDDDGRFVLSGLPPNATTLVWVASEATGAWTKILPIQGKIDEEGTDVEVQFQLVTSSQFTGRVLKNGRPVQGLKLEVFRSLAGDQNRLRPFTTISTDHDGRYMVGGLEPGDQYRFKILTDDDSMAADWQFQAPYVQIVAPNHQGLKELPDANLISTTQSLRGVVIDPDGNRLPGISVDASLKNGGPIPRRDDAPPHRTVTDSHGEFHLEHLPESSIKLIAYTTDPQGGRIHFPAQILVDLNQQDIRIVLDSSLREPLESLDPQ